MCSLLSGSSCYLGLPPSTKSPLPQPCKRGFPNLRVGPSNLEILSETRTILMIRLQFMGAMFFTVVGAGCVSITAGRHWTEGMLSRCRLTLHFLAQGRSGRSPSVPHRFGCSAPGLHVRRGLLGSSRLGATPYATSGTKSASEN